MLNVSVKCDMHRLPQPVKLRTSLAQIHVASTCSCEDERLRRAVSTVCPLEIAYHYDSVCSHSHAAPTGKNAPDGQTSAMDNIFHEAPIKGNFHSNTSGLPHSVPEASEKLHGSHRLGHLPFEFL